MIEVEIRVIHTTFTRAKTVVAENFIPVIGLIILTVITRLMEREWHLLMKIGMVATEEVVEENETMLAVATDEITEGVVGAAEVEEGAKDPTITAVV